MNEPSESVKTEIPEKSNRKSFYLLIVIVVLLLSIWFLVRPGVFTVQPIGALPEGITFVYYSRSPEVPFFSSPDGLCLQVQGSVTLLCRAAGFAVVDEFSDRIILRLPYSHWAYLQSTDGREFDR